jgi:hypothetical protein
LNLVDCEDINNMYVNAVHSATCNYAPAAMGWIYGTLLTISISGMIMITLRASYLTPEQEASDEDTKSPKLSKQRAQESAERLQNLFRNRQSKQQLRSDNRMVLSSIPEEISSPSQQHNYSTENDVLYALPPYLARDHNLSFVVITPEEQDDISAL